MAPKKQSRAKRGTVSVCARSGMLRLRWRFEGREFQLSLGLRDTPFHRTISERQAKEIEVDIAIGEFDPTLKKYKPDPQEPEKEEFTTVAMFEWFIEYRVKAGTSGQAISSRYKPLLANLKRFDLNITTEQQAREFMELLRSRQLPTISNQNLSLLKGFSNWAIEQGYLETNPFTNIKPVKATRNRRKPFTREEISKILASAKFHRKYSHYHDFIYCLLSLGLRPSELIGLRWRDIDFVACRVTISEALSRSPEGKASGSNRARKSTKTGSQRTLKLNQGLVTVLSGRKPPEAKPDSLVFTSATGLPIDDHTFSQRQWRTILKDAGVEYRPPYTCRHTFTSHLLESGKASLTQAASTLGHNSTRMVAETYAHMLESPDLPEF